MVLLLDSVNTLVCGWWVMNNLMCPERALKTIKPTNLRDKIKIPASQSSSCWGR